MIDWFIILTPILLLPIALLFFFVGCASATSSHDTFRINCYLENVRLSHNFEIRIFDSGTEILREQTDVHKVTAGGDVTSQVRFGFAEKLPPGRATLSCQVIDRTTGDLLVDKGDTCEGDFEVGEAYDFVFNAGISDDGVEPNTVFDECTPFPRQT